MTWFLVYGEPTVCPGLVVAAETDPKCDGYGKVIWAPPGRFTPWKVGASFRFGPQDNFNPGERTILTIDDLPDDLLAEWVKFNLSNQEGDV